MTIMIWVQKTRIMIDFIKNNKTLKELIAGIVIVSLLFEILTLLICKDRLYGTIGLIAGTVSAVLCAVYMAYSIEIAVLLDEKSSIAYMRKGTVFRYLFLCLILIVVGITDIGSPVTLIFGFLSLKFGAYLNPMIHKLLHGNEKGHTDDIEEDDFTKIGGGCNE